jgi:hypothetical protein
MLSIYRVVLVLLFFLFIVGCERTEKKTISSIQPHCLASQSLCKISNSFGEILVLFDVEKVITEQAFNIIIKTEHDSPDLKVTGYLEGKDMFMGKIPLFFQKNDSADYSTEAFLGSCSEEQMVWRMWLTFTDSTSNNTKEKQTAFIDFTSSRS